MLIRICTALFIFALLFNNYAFGMQMALVTMNEGGISKTDGIFTCYIKLKDLHLFSRNFKALNWNMYTHLFT